jgi:hypothetical protein
MNIFSFFKKYANFFIIGLFAINPILVKAETEVFPDATSAEEVYSTSTDNIVEISSTTKEVAPVRELITEPLVRVGLYKTSEPVKFKSNFVYQIWNGGELRGLISPGELVEINYTNRLYNFKSDSLEFGSKDYFRLVPQDQNNYFSLVNYSRAVKGRSKINFNVYHGTLEYRYSPKSKMPYIINELPLDLYVQGIAETSEGVPMEYMKALSVAARSYANALISSVPATEKRLFDVYATTADQLYLGYNSELFMPKFVLATQATAGEMVTYRSNPVITFYFSHSSGNTKSAGKDRPWLKSVVAKYDKGKKMSGHGIGMSNYDAQQRALREGLNYKQILEYYYTDTAVEKIY